MSSTKKTLEDLVNEGMCDKLSTPQDREGLSERLNKTDRELLETKYEELLSELLQIEYNQRLVVSRLRREAYQQPDPSASLDDLVREEEELNTVEQLRAAVQHNSPSGLILNNTTTPGLLGRQSTRLEATVHLRMAYLPTSICHLLDSDQERLVTCTVQNFSERIRRLRVTSIYRGLLGPGRRHS